jgi:hypothetical protein
MIKNLLSDRAFFLIVLTRRGKNFLENKSDLFIKTYSMNNLYNALRAKLLVAVICMISFSYQAQTTFQKVYPTSYDKTARDIMPTPDGGYLMVGYTNNNNMNDCDMYVMKADAQGNLLWDREFGGSRPDYAYNIIETGDGNYFVIGYSASFGSGDLDVYLVKMDPSGNKIWEKTYIGFGNEEGREIVPAGDGNFVIVGSTNSNLSSQDVFLMKIDPTGSVMWIKYYGGSGSETGDSVKRCPDGGFIVGGETYSYGQGGDAFLIRTNSNGDTLWTKHFGGAQSEEIVSVISNNDGSYTYAVRDSSNGRDVDVRIMKSDASGNVVWNKLYSGPDKDTPHRINPVNDGGYIVGAISRSFGWINPDMWVLRLNSGGDTLWSKHFGDTEHEHCYSAKQSADGGFLACGHSRSYGPSQKVMFVKMSDAGTVSIEEQLANTQRFGIYPNPTIDGKLYLKGGPDNYNIKVYTASGQLLMEKTTDAMKPEESGIVDLKGNVPGIYLIRLEANGMVSNSKVILR